MPLDLVLTALLALAPAPPPPTSADQELVLPAGPALAAWERAADATPKVPDGAGAPWPAWGTAAWDAPQTWARFEALVEAAPSAARAFDLALLARAQGRHDDLWRRFAALDDPAALAALVDRLFAAEHDAGGALVLRPPLPPPDPDATEYPFVGRSLARTWTTSEGTTLTLTVKIEPDGTQVDVLHAGGPPLDVRVALPVPPGVRVAVVYADWARQDEATSTLAFRCSAEDPEHTAWGRYLPAPRAWPRATPDVLPANVREAGLELLWEHATPPPARLGHAAATYGRLLGVPARVATELVPRSGAAPLRIHLGPDAAAKEVDLFGLVARWASDRP